MHAQDGGVNDALEADINQLMAWLLELPSLIDSEAEVVSAWADASIREDIVDAAVVLVGGLEESADVGPIGDVGLDEGEGWGCGGVGGGVDVSADYGGAKREEEGDSCEANA